jgi:extracellular factor (EF) 3-hydroxypalmitic acid methyl ester biosynthesis protein
MKNLITQNWLLRDLTESETESLFQKMTPLVFESEKTLVEKGKSNDSLWIITSGTIDILNPAAAEPAVVASLGPGDLFGEMSWLDGQKASATIRARANSQILKIRFTDFDKILALFPDAHIGILRKFAINLSHRLRQKS